MTLVSPPARLLPLLSTGFAALVGLSALAGCSGDGDASDGADGNGSGANGTGTGGEDGSGGSGADGTGAGGSGSGGDGNGGSSSGGSASGGSGTGGGGGTGGQPDTCPMSNAAWELDYPDPPGANTTRNHAVLQVPSTGSPRVLAVDMYQNGSFYDANLRRFERNGPQSWSVQGIANGGLGLSVARSLGVTHGDDPCVAYTLDYDGTLHLKCDSAGDLTIAPSASSGVSIGEIGTAKLVVFNEGGDTLRAVTVDPTADVPVTIDSAWVMGATSLQVDDLGVPHLAYVASESGADGALRRVHYATRNGGVWSTDTVETDVWSGNPSNEGDSVSLALVDGSPVIAYHHRQDRSLKLARHDGAGWVTTTLDEPQPGYPNDVAGRSVALQVDCLDRVRVVYERIYTTDVQPNLHLFHAEIVGDALVSPKAFPMTASTAYKFFSAPHGLGYFVDEDGTEHVSAELGSIYGRAVYYATR